MTKPSEIQPILHHHSQNVNTVKPADSGHLRFLKKVSAKTRCPLYRVLDFLGNNRQLKLRLRIFILRSKETPLATPIPRLIENTFTAFKYSFLSRGLHVYKDVWIPITSDDSLTCKQEEHNEND